MKNDIRKDEPTSQSLRILVWDIPVRLFHWTQLGLLIGLYITAEVLDDGIELHAKLGIALLALVLFRLMWGWFGSTYARFNRILHKPQQIIFALRSLFSRQPHFEAGHNALGGIMVILLLSLVLLQAVFGLFSNDDILFDGPFSHLVSKDTSDLITSLHGLLFNVLLVLAGLHVAAIFWHQLFKRDNLIRPMITGYKRLPPGITAENAQGGGLLRAILLAIVCGGAVYWATLS